MARLVVISKDVTAPPLELSGGWMTIGRADGNTLQIVETSVSGRHCEVRLQGEELAVRDLLSTNGTFVDGKKISEATIKPGQMLRVGDVDLCFEAAPANTELPGTSFISKMLIMNSAARDAAKAAPAKEPVAEPAAAEPADDSKKFHVLFVDDSMAFLEMFGGLCNEYANKTWAVHTATSADRALALLKEKPVDLVVLDIGMPMLDGLQLLGLITRRYPGLKTVVMTGKATEAKRADALTNGADLFLEKQLTAEGMKSTFNMLNDLVSWAHLEGFTGALRHVGLQEVIQMECNSRHSSILEIRNAELRGQIYIEAGAITHAAVGSLTGEQAFYRLMSLRGGEFQLKPFKAPAQRTIESRWEFLVMDAARATDEETVLLKKTPEPPAPGPEPEKSEHVAIGEELIEVATYDGKWKPAASGASGGVKPGPDAAPGGSK
ncbi:MAG TPA: response regulator [Verrucomicrobiae bacterium]|nr:response regulator [Verrucomicrobiae bacterium]